MLDVHWGNQSDARIAADAGGIPDASDTKRCVDDTQNGHGVAAPVVEYVLGVTTMCPRQPCKGEGFHERGRADHAPASTQRARAAGCASSGWVRVLEY